MRGSNTSNSDDAPEYWNGIYVLWGENRGQEWQAKLNIEAWYIAVIRFNREIQKKVNSIHMPKYDELFIWRSLSTIAFKLSRPDQIRFDLFSLGR